MRIDAHSHMCGELSTQNGIKDYMRRNKLDKIILCAGEPNGTKNYSLPRLSKIFRGQGLMLFFNSIITFIAKKKGLSLTLDEGNKNVMSICSSNKDKFLMKYWTNPNCKNYISKMKTLYEKYPFHMVKLHQCWTPFEISNNSMSSIISFCRHHNIPLFIHLKSLNDWENIISIARQNTDITFILAHMIGVNKSIPDIPNNVYYDCSAPQLYSLKMLKHAIHKYGTSRIILGSDTPYGSNNLSIIETNLEKLKLNQQGIKNILGQNIYNILYKK